MKQFYNRSLAIIALFVALATTANAQRYTLYNSATLYNSIENPAQQLFTDSCKKFAINNFLYANTYISAGVQGPLGKVILESAFRKGEFVNPEDFGSKNGLATTNQIYTQTALNLLQLKFRVNAAKAAEVSFSLSAHTSTEYSIKNELVNLLARGNGPYAGKKLNNIFNTDINFLSYGRASAGYRQDVNERLSVGVRGDLLYGFVGVKGIINRSSFFTEQNGEYVEISARGEFNTTLSEENTKDSKSITNSFSKFKNPGVGGSVGSTYKLTENLTLTAGIRDLGIIFWNKDSYRYRADKSVRFDGTNAFDSETVRDSIFEKFAELVVDTQQRAFRSYLISTAEAGANYKFGKLSSTTVNISKKLNRKDLDLVLVEDIGLGPFHFIASGIYNSTNVFNVGGTFMLRTKGLDLWFTSERLGNVVSILRRAEDYSRKSNFPLAVDYGMGMAFKFGRCPKEEPIIAGPIDTDLDGLIDNIDACPYEAGPVDNNGCPYLDTDADGLLDKDDTCPTEAGPAENKGCPYVDTDSDGLLDKDDACPTVAGPSENKGCPYQDTDGDGLLDKDDACPTAAGSIDNKGCPFQDADGDGVLDKDDQCPTVKGLIERKGCPAPDAPKKVELTQEEQEVINKVFKNLNFETGKAIIAGASYQSLEDLVALLVKKPSFKLLIEGHTDNVGSLTSNTKLSQSRADAVKKFFTDRGITSDRLKSFGYGPSKPVAVNTTVEGRAQNRRVEFTIIE